MKWKTLLMLIIVAIGGIALGAVGMHYVGSWEGITQLLATLRQPESSSQATRRAAADRPTDQFGHDAHKGNALQEDTHEHGVAPHLHNTDEHGHAATTEARLQADRDGHNREQPLAVTAKGASPSKEDTHRYKEEEHRHGAEPSRQTKAQSAHVAKTDTHEHGEDAHDHDTEQVVRLSADKV